MSRSVCEPSETVTKTLFALSANVCAFSDPETGRGCEERLTDPSWSRVLARICHIRGCRPGSARYDSTMTPSQRNAFENLILLCPNHHALVDELEPARFTVEALTEMKQAAEGATTRSGQPWASDSDLETYARALLAQMRQLWRGAELEPAVEARRIRAGTTIEYAGQPVVIEDVRPYEQGDGVHLTFAEQVFDRHGTGVVGWDLAPGDLVTLWAEPS